MNRPAPSGSSRDGVATKTAINPSRLPAHLREFLPQGAADGDPKPETEADLVKRCQQELPECSDAYQILVDRYRSMVYSTCLRMLGSVPDAEEVSQDVWVKVFNAVHGFEHRSTFKTWLFHIVNSHCLDRKRKLASERVKRERFLELVGRHIAAGMRLEIDIRATAETVSASMQKLKPAQRQILELRFYSDLSLNEIAEHLEIKLSAAKMRLSRAMDEFQVVHARTAGAAAF